MTLQEQWRDLARQARELRLEKSCSTDWYILTKVAQTLEGCAADLDRKQGKGQAQQQGWWAERVKIRGVTHIHDEIIVDIETYK